ncbi:MAG: alpha/beta fold hydrolase [Planctomycetota bacterium]|nr:alpha/beta fold hydrolase [Planctomycetota bacterium]
MSHAVETPLPAAIAAEYPFESRFLEVDGGRMHYVDEGPRGGDPILFLHGNPTWSYLWRKLVRELRATHRCIALDHIGCGLSAKPADWRYTLAAHAENTLALVERLDLERVTLVVHDWGGAIGMSTVSRASGRFARLLALNTAAFPGAMPLRIRACRAPIVGPILVEQFNAFAGLLPRFGLAEPSRLTPAARQGFAFPYRTAADRRAIRAFVEDIPTSSAHPSWKELGSASQAVARFVAKPVSIVWGQRDWCFTPRFRAQWQSRLPAANVVPVEHAGHLVTEEAPSEVEAELRALLAR